MKQQFQLYLQANGHLPTAIFCECDYIAISAIKTLNELGIRVPEDVSVIGFDNITELLIERIEQGIDITSKTTIDTKFIERLSCRAPARSN
jgi:LacI family purine nucleotide synthesis repressor